MANQQLLLRNLHTFNLVAKTMSFTLAAQELHLTQGAISHRIKVLEQELGFSLFVRGTRKLELTSEGYRFQSTLSKSLRNIFSEIDEINATEMEGELNIATSSGFASGWLVPRLADFKAKYPKFNVNLFAHEEQQDFEHNDVEVAIYFDSKERTNVYRKRLLGEKYIPICSPKYAKQHNLYQGGLESLKHINFIHAKGSNSWQRWMDYMNLDIDIYKQYYGVSHREMGFLAAENHLGVPMGRCHVVKDAIESGVLVTPYPSLETSSGYDLLCPIGTENRPKIRTFINWVEGELS